MLTAVGPGKGNHCFEEALHGIFHVFQLSGPMHRPPALSGG